MFKYFRKRRAIRHTREALQRLSNRELYDIGISRCDIEYIARHTSVY